MIEQYYRENKSTQVKKIARILDWDFSSAEDVVQEAYKRAIKYYPTYVDGQGPFSAWFNSILMNSLRDWKKQSRDNGVVKDGKEEEIPEELPYLNVEVNRGVILKEIKELLGDARIKQTLYCWYILGLSSKEISEIVNGMSVTNVTTVTSRFKKLLGDKYGEG